MDAELVLSVCLLTESQVESEMFPGLLVADIATLLIPGPGGRWGEGRWQMVMTGVPGRAPGHDLLTPVSS